MWSSSRDIGLQLNVSVHSRATFATEDVLILGQEAFTHQGYGAPPTVKAITVPLAILKADKLGTSETSNGFTASCTFFGIKMVVAVQTEWIIISGHKLFFTELFPTATTEKALFMPRLVMKCYSTWSYRLLTKVAIVSKFLLKTWHTVIATFFGN